MSKPKFENTVAYARQHPELPPVPALERRRAQLKAMRLRDHHYGINRRRARMLCRLSSTFDPMRAASRRFSAR